MKQCTGCGSAAFDDMEMCYDCMTSFAQEIDSNKENLVLSVARLQVALAGYFSYELLLSKLEGKSLSVGSAAQNAIVIPQEQVAAHQLEVFYAQGRIWAESTDTSFETVVGETPLYGTVCIKPGIDISVGSATITILEE